MWRYGRLQPWAQDGHCFRPERPLKLKEPTHPHAQCPTFLLEQRQREVTAPLELPPPLQGASVKGGPFIPSHLCGSYHFFPSYSQGEKRPRDHAIFFPHKSAWHWIDHLVRLSFHCLVGQGSPLCHTAAFIIFQSDYSPRMEHMIIWGGRR